MIMPFGVPNCKVRQTKFGSNFGIIHIPGVSNHVRCPVRQIFEGNRVIVRSADDRRLPRRAVTGIVQGDDFPVVWVCREEEWVSARAENRAPEAVPWPAEDVRLANDANDTT